MLMRGDAGHPNSLNRAASRYVTLSLLGTSDLTAIGPVHFPPRKRAFGPGYLTSAMPESRLSRLQLLRCWSGRICGCDAGGQGLKHGNQDRKGSRWSLRFGTKDVRRRQRHTPFLGLHSPRKGDAIYR